MLLISFGPRYIAEHWRYPLGVNYPLLLDTDRTTYRAYGLTSSVWGSFGLRATWYYIRHLRLPNIKGNPVQLGGDFVLDSDGVLRFIHCSRHAADRPPIEQLLAAL